MIDRKNYVVIKGEMTAQSLIKLLTGSGAGSRRQMAEAIKQGRVMVNGKVVDSYIQPVEVEKDMVTLDGRSVTSGSNAPVYLMLNKPKGIISSTHDERGNKTVTDIIPKKYRSMGLHPVGRLDKDSTGLILLTNDGDFTYRLTHPRFEHEKEYYVWIEGNLTAEEESRLEKGLDLDDGKTSPAKVRKIKSLPYNYSITIHEGKKRQVRRMFAHLGYRVLELKRVRIGSLNIGGLAAGEARELTSQELKVLKKG